jgi:hypothetical protein
MREKDQNYEKRKTLYRSLQVESFNVLKSMNYELYHLQVNANETNSNLSQSCSTPETSKEQEEEVSKLKNEIQNLQKEFEMLSKPKKESAEVENVLEEMKVYDEKTQKEIEMNKCLIQEADNNLEILEHILFELAEEQVAIQNDIQKQNNELSPLNCIKCNESLGL